MTGILSRYNDLEPDVRWRITFGAAFILGLLTLVVMGITSFGPGKLQRTMAAFLLAGSAAAVGAFLGFLFGIPRSQQGEAVQAAAQDGTPRNYSENTNLEQISDWLTKIIVGLTLVQFQELLELLKSISAAYGPAILTHPNAAVPQAAAMAIIVYFLMASLLFVYLWTRIYVETLFRQHRTLANYNLKKMIKQLEEEAGSEDIKAIQLTDEYLDEKSDPDNPKFDKIREVVAASSHLSRTLIFDRARTARKEAWENKDPVQAAKVIPIFHGLNDREPDKYHRNYGQLGYAHLLAPSPDWAAAKEALEKAIKLRGDDAQTAGSGLYEFNLAIALINLDPDFQANKKSSAAVTAQLTDLLDKGKTVVPTLNEPVIEKWAKKNGYSI